MRKALTRMGLLVLVALVTACSAPPYVHKPGQYNRASADFGRPVIDISSVTICYHSSSATPQQVRKMAVDECGRFNKRAEFSEQNYETCPLTTPVAAVYSCIGDGLAGGEENGVGGIPSGTLMHYDGIPFRY